MSDLLHRKCMDRHIKKYYSVSSKKEGFSSVIPLHEEDLSWEQLQEKMPAFPRGWYELSKLSSEDRLDFICQFWISKIPFHPKFSDFITKFFKRLDDIGIFLFQRKKSSPFEAEMVYSLDQNRGFFRGAVPAQEVDLIEIEVTFPDFIFPQDYLAFLEIHNGFCKATDSTGIISTGQLKQVYDTFQKILKAKEPLTITEGQVVDAQTLIPFYESFGMPYFQCFWGEWYPINEMGNVYYCQPEHTLSDIANKGTGTESLAFPNFTDWLMFYLEQIG